MFLSPPDEHVGAVGDDVVDVEKVKLVLRKRDRSEKLEQKLSALGVRTHLESQSDQCERAPENPKHSYESG